MNKQNTIKQSDENSLKLFSDIIKKYKLYDTKGEINFILNDVERGFIPTSHVSILINYNGHIPVACLLKIRNRLLCYVKPEFRKQNIGRNLVSILKNEKSYANKGFQNSDLFWGKLKVLVF